MTRTRRVAGAGAPGASVRAAEGGGGTCAQPAASRIAAAKTEAPRAMWVVILEMFLALALLVLIVWWTWPKKPRDGEGDR